MTNAHGLPGSIRAQQPSLPACACPRLAAMAHGDASVKARLCQREVLTGMMGLAPHMGPERQASAATAQRGMQLLRRVSPAMGPMLWSCGRL